MALVTRCSSCGTTYKIYPEQLQVQNGFVRCGDCRTVFNGFATLITVDESEIEYSLSLAGQQARTYTPSRQDADIAKSALLNEAQCNEVTEPLIEKGDDNQSITDAGQYAVSLIPAEAAIFEPGRAVVTGQDSSFLSDEKPPLTREYWTWMAACAGMILLFVIQGVYAFRADLVKSFPSSKPALEVFCMPLGCSLPLPEDIQLFSIIHSDLEVREPEYYPEVLTLTTIFRNHATYTQALPALKVSLTDRHNQLLASRVFAADEYLSRAQKGLTAMKRGQELVIQLHIDNSDLKSTGYQVELMYL